MKKLRFQIKKILILSMVVINLLPFFIHDIYADDYTGSTIQGFNVSLIDVEQTLVNSGGTSGYMSKYIYEVEFILDDSYVGYINISGEIKFYPYNSSSLTTYNLSGRNYFVNGTSFKLTFQLTGDGYTADNRPSLNNTIFTYGNHNLYKHSEIDSLETIIDLLTDLYNNTDTVEGLLNNQLTQLQLIAQRCNISNQYLETISNTKQWHFPLESFNFIYYHFDKNRELFNIYKDTYYDYPIFILNNNNLVFDRYIQSNQYLRIVFGTTTNANNLNEFKNLYSVSNGFEIRNFILINTSTLYKFIQIDIYPLSSGANCEIRTNSTTEKFIPIYALRSDYIENGYVSTDFALMWGLSNRLLDNLKIIANGTTQSNQSASNVEQSNTTLETSQNQMFNFENQQNQNMNNALNQIDTNFNIGNVFGSSFLASADWVRTQFNLMTGGNAFGSVLSFSLLLGLSLLIIGKVLG